MQELHSVLSELLPLEPLFHTPAFGTTIADFERRMAADYWEVGASGRRYSRAFILDWLTEQAPVSASEAGWQTHGHALRQLGPDTYLLTYTLQQGERITRRTTIWRTILGGWQIVFHQGTIVTSEEDDIAPS